MSLAKSYDGYRSFSYLEPGVDYKAFELAPEIDRVPSHPVPARRRAGGSRTGARRALPLRVDARAPRRLPARIEETPEYARHGRMATAFEGLAASYWDCVFDNLMDGICRIHSSSGWQWDDVLHDLGMRLCDLAHQDFVVPCLRVDDVQSGRTRAAGSRGSRRWRAPR